MPRVFASGPCDMSAQCFEITRACPGLQAPMIHTHCIVLSRSGTIRKSVRVVRNRIFPCCGLSTGRPLLSSCRGTIFGSVGSLQSDGAFTGWRALTIDSLLLCVCVWVISWTEREYVNEVLDHVSSASCKQKWKYRPKMLHNKGFHSIAYSD